MAVAALYDVHGNLPALTAVLADVRLAHADTIVCGGDLVAGPMPAACLDALLALGSRVRFLRGNGDREVAEGHGAHGGAWCAGELGPARLELVRSWPLTLELDALGGATFCHATPRADDEVITLLTPETELEHALGPAAHPLVVVGHTHVQGERRLESGRRLVNAGSVGRPYQGVPGSYWALLGERVELLRTDYDVESAAAAIEASGYPDAAAHAADLRQSPSADDATAFFEERRGT